MRVQKIEFYADAFARVLTWDDIIGFKDGLSGSASVNLRAEVSEPPAGTTLAVRLVSRAPNAAGGEATLGGARTVNLTRKTPQPAGTKNAMYTATLTPASLGFGGEARGAATVVRSGSDATSDQHFRQALGIGRARRGWGTQTARVGTGTGFEAAERPDAGLLMRASGLEVLEAGFTLAGRPTAAAKRLVRSPAWVFYYSGHGLARDDGPLVVHQDGGYVPWLDGKELAAAWKVRVGPKVLVVGGCSVLGVDGSTGPGRAWAGLLSTNGGPCSTLLGYSASAPLDANGGNDIAKAVGEVILKGLKSDDLVKEWLAINGRKRAWNAVAINTRGYWHLEPTQLPLDGRNLPYEIGGSIVGPDPL